jgi:hypothetical protein
MKCATCDNEISAARLQAKPDATDCIDCATNNDEPKSVGYMVWDHKTAPYVEIDSITAIKFAGKRHRYGPHIQFNPKEGLYGCAEPMERARTLRDLMERLRRENRNLPDPDSGLEPVMAYPARCHPDKPRIGPNGLCLECALAIQAKRLK